jgi:hypothetical protein
MVEIEELRAGNSRGASAARASLYPMSPGLLKREKP